MCISRLLAWTIDVIGVVAVMTLPTVIGNYKKKITVNSLKQSYVFLHSIRQRASVDYGDMSSWDVFDDEDMTPEEVVSKYFVPYIKGSKVKLEVKELRQYIIHWMDGSDVSLYLATSFMSPQGYYYHVNKVGTLFYYIYIDINGKKRPNIVGKDVFIVLFDKNGIRFDDRNFVNNVSKHCMIGSGNGSQCGAKIERDGWEIKDDYPW